MKTLWFVLMASAMGFGQMTVISGKAHITNHGGWEIVSIGGANAGDKVTLEVTCTDMGQPQLDCFVIPPADQDGHAFAPVRDPLGRQLYQLSAPRSVDPQVIHAVTRGFGIDWQFDITVQGVESADYSSGAGQKH